MSSVCVCVYVYITLRIHMPLAHSFVRSLARSLAYNNKSCYECHAHHRVPFAMLRFCNIRQLFKKKRKNISMIASDCRALVDILLIDRIQSSQLLLFCLSLLISGITKAIMTMTSSSIVIVN